MSALALKLKKEDINSFCQKNHFEKTKDDFVINFWGMRLLDSSFCKFPSKSSLYFKEGRNKVNTWVYLIDTSNGCVFGEIQYPDWSGDAP